MNIGAPNTSQATETTYRNNILHLSQGIHRSNTNQKLSSSSNPQLPFQCARPHASPDEKAAVVTSIRQTLLENHGEHVTTMALDQHVTDNELTLHAARCVFEHVDATKTAIQNVKTAVNRIHEVATEADAMNHTNFRGDTAVLLQGMQETNNHNLVDLVTNATTAVEIASNIAVNVRTKLVTDTHPTSTTGHVLTHRAAEAQVALAKNAKNAAKDATASMTTLVDRANNLPEETTALMITQQADANTFANNARNAYNTANTRLAEYTDSDRSSDSSGGSSHK